MEAPFPDENDDEYVPEIEGSVEATRKKIVNLQQKSHALEINMLLHIFLEKVSDP